MSFMPNNAIDIAIINTLNTNVLIIFITFVLTFLDDFIASKGKVWFNKIREELGR